MYFVLDIIDEAVVLPWLKSVYSGRNKMIKMNERIKLIENEIKTFESDQKQDTRIKIIFIIFACGFVYYLYKKLKYRLLEGLKKSIKKQVDVQIKESYTHFA